MPAAVDVDAPASLGLRIVQQLVRQIRGTLQVRTSPGTTFTITFPGG
jgi:two-component sensor histidine kinase